MRKRSLATFFILLVLAPIQSYPKEPVSDPVQYELKLVYIFDQKAPEFIFVIGNSGFKSVEALKEFLGRLPAGSEITWNPGCERIGKEPLLSSEKEMNAFHKFLKKKGIKFNLIPAG